MLKYILKLNSYWYHKMHQKRGFLNDFPRSLYVKELVYSCVFYFSGT